VGRADHQLPTLTVAALVQDGAPAADVMKHDKLAGILADICAREQSNRAHATAEDGMSEARIPRRWRDSAGWDLEGLGDGSSRGEEGGGRAFCHDVG
jgi:hypothetical protein